MAALYLGRDPQTKRLTRLRLERHALTIAGARMGKGACQIIPTLREWDSSAIVIDPKGEAVIATAAERQKLGQEIAVLDPMNLVPDKFAAFKKTFDPLSLVRDGGAGFRDIQMIADGLVMVTGREHDPHWNESALSTIAGLIAYLVESEEEQCPDLGLLPVLLRHLRNPETRDPLLKQLTACRTFGGLAADIAAQFAAETNETSGILSTTGRHLRFLGDEDIVRTLQPGPAEDTLDLTRLRDGDLTLYVVIDPGALVLHSRFMRLFVRMALAVMMRTRFAGGKSTNKPCLFVLDEFFSLGKITEIQKAAGLMPGYGVHLWPILQDWGQLLELYDTYGAQTFLANADAIAVFGIADAATLREVSGWFGTVSAEELQDDALSLAGARESSELWRKFGPLSTGRSDYVPNQRLTVMSALLQARIGRPRKSPAEIQYALGKAPEEAVARRMYVFLRTGEILDLIPQPYFV